MMSKRVLLAVDALSLDVCTPECIALDLFVCLDLKSLIAYLHRKIANDTACFEWKVGFGRA